jgi:hypothetical protein
MRNFIIYTAHATIKSRCVKGVEDVTLMGKKFIQSFVRKAERKRLIGRPGHIW